MIAFPFVIVLTLFLPALIPNIHLLFFAPALIILYYKKPLVFCLWVSLFCGLLLDLLAGQHRLGLHAINYCLVTGLLYQQKRNFFEDSLTTLPIMTFFFAVLSTTIQVVLLYIFETGIAVSWEWVGIDLLIMPLFDAFYAFFFFTLPMAVLYKKVRRSGDEY